MTKKTIACEIRNIRNELGWLSWCERKTNPDWPFRSTPYSKRRRRLVKTYWALMAMQKQGGQNF